MSQSPRKQAVKPEKSKSPITIDGDTAIFKIKEGQKVFGSDNEAFIHGLLFDIINIASKGKTPDEERSGYVSAIVGGINPQDQIEAMLATQMAAIHMATMTFSRRLSHVETIPQQDSAERALNKLARTFTAQVEALKRYRTGGQNITVKHVNVSDGGQAIVGNVHHGGRGGEKK